MFTHTQAEPALALPPERRRFTPPRWLIWAAAVLLALAIGIGGLAAFDPDGFNTIVERARTVLPIGPSDSAPVDTDSETTEPTDSEDTPAPEPATDEQRDGNAAEEAPPPASADE